MSPFFVTQARPSLVWSRISLMGKIMGGTMELMGRPLHGHLNDGRLGDGGNTARREIQFLTML